MAGDNRQARAGNRPEQHIDWRWRWTLRRWGTEDGRRREPDPLIAARPIRTSARRLLEWQLQEQVERVGVRYGREIASRHQHLEALDMRIAQLEDSVAALTVELDKLTEERPAQTTPNGQDNLSGRRWERKHSRRCETIRQRRREIEERLKKEREEWAAMVAAIEGLQQQQVHEAQRLRATFTHAEAIYNRALIKRHPEGSIVRMMLDSSTFWLPDWAERTDTPRRENEPA